MYCMLKELHITRYASSHHHPTLVCLDQHQDIFSSD